MTDQRSYPRGPINQHKSLATDSGLRSSPPKENSNGNTAANATVGSNQDSIHCNEKMIKP